MKFESQKYVLNRHVSTPESHFTSNTLNSFSPPGVYDDQSQATSISYIKGAFQAPLAKAEHEVHADFSVGSLGSFVKESRRSRRQKVAFYLILIFLVMCGIAGAAAFAISSDDQDSAADSENQANTAEPTITPTEIADNPISNPLSDIPVGDDLTTNAPTNLLTLNPTLLPTINPTRIETQVPTAEPTKPATEPGIQSMQFSFLGLSSLVFDALPEEQFITHVAEVADSVGVFSFQDGNLNSEACDIVPEYPCDFGVLSDIPTQGVCAADNECEPIESFTFGTHTVDLKLGGPFDNLVTDCLSGIEQVACFDHDFTTYTVVVIECRIQQVTEIVISINPDTLQSGTPCSLV